MYQIWTLPKLSIVFSNSIVTDLPTILADSFDPPALSIPEDPPRKPDELDIDQIMLAPLGDLHPQPHLMVRSCGFIIEVLPHGYFQVLLRCGQFAVYQAIPDEKLEWPPENKRATALRLTFAKKASRAFEPRQEVTEKSTLSEQRRILRILIAFETWPTRDRSLQGVFFTGDQPCWILATAKDGVKIHSCGYAVVNSFTSCSIWDSKNDFLLYTDEVRALSFIQL